MQSINTWNTLFEGKYGDRGLSIYYEEDIIVSVVRPKDSTTAIVQLYKAFSVEGDIETFAETLPSQCIVYQKHFDIGEKNTYKFLILNTETEAIDGQDLNNYIEKKITQLNKTTGSIISIVKSYDIKLISLKMLPTNVKNIFFSDPFVVKALANQPISPDLSVMSSIDKLLLGKKNGVAINTSLETLNSVCVVNGTLDERVFAIKLICENYLLSFRKVVAFDSTGVFRTISYPQQKEELLSDFDMKVSPFGFSSNNYEYFKFKLPLHAIPKGAFINEFRFTGISQKIIDICYTSDIKDISELIDKIIRLDITDEITDFEKWRIIAKMNILNDKYGSCFGDTDISQVFENPYKNIGAGKIFQINTSDPFYVYYVFYMIKKISEETKEELLIVLPELPAVVNNSFIGNELITLLQQNPKLSYIISSEHLNDFLNKNITDVRIEMIYGNDAVIRYPEKDPLRLLLRPTLTSSNIDIKKE